MYFGEAGTKIMDDHPAFVEAHPEILWRGMRNRIAHGYFDINLDLVWETVQRSPKLKARPDLKRLATPRVGAWRSPSISRAQTR